VPSGSPFSTFGLSISREPGMHGVFTRMLLHQLLEEAGGDKAEAARRAGIGRSTMYRWIDAGLLDQPLETIRARHGPRERKPSKLAPFHAIIEARLAEYPRLSGTRLFAECRAAGYSGGITQLRDFVRRLRPAPEPITRFETEPGQQAQVDFAHCRFPTRLRLRCDVGATQRTVRNSEVGNMTRTCWMHSRGSCERIRYFACTAEH
jgi:transposase